MRGEARHSHGKAGLTHVAVDGCGISRVEPCDTDHGAARSDERAVRTALRLVLRVLDEL